MTLSGPTTPTGVMIAGWYGMDNVGDDAILDQFLHEMPPGPDQPVTVLAHNAARVHARWGGEHLRAIQHLRFTNRQGIRHLIRGRHKPLLEAIRGSRVLVIGGGSLIHDRSGLHGLLPVVDDIFLASRLGVPVWTYGLGVGPLTGGRERWIARQALRRCERIFLRDHGSAAVVAGLGIDPARVTVVADPVFLLPPSPPSARALAPLGDLDGRVGVFLKTALQLPGDRQRALIAWLAREFDALHARDGTRFILLPMMTQPEDDDRVIARAVRDRMTAPGILTLSDRAFPPEETAWLARRFRATISVRLHALIFSLAGAVPAVGIGYDPKVGNLMRDFGREDALVGMHPPEPGRLVAAFDAALAAGGDADRAARATAEAATFFAALRKRLAAA